MIMGVPVAVPVKWKIEFCWTLLQPFESFNRSTLHQCAFAGKLQIWVCNFHGQLKVSKAGMFDFGEKDPRNRHAQHTFEGHIPGWARYFETYPYNPIICISHLQHYKLQLIYYTYRLTDITLQTL